MKHLALLVSLFISNISYAQFSVISDKDGYTNVRDDAKKESKLLDSLKNGHLIFVWENRGKWSVIDYSKNNSERHGFIYFDRYKSISDYPKIPLVAQTDSSVKIAKDSIEVIVTQRKFDKKKHKYKYYKESPTEIEFIDNKQYWGTDGGLPTMEYSGIKIKIGRIVFVAPKLATENLYEPNLDTVEVNYDKEKGMIYIQTMNSDGAGAYFVVWKFKNGVYQDRLIAYGF
jgi:hypothetical protein